jgi:hypothetical protein
MSHRHHNDRRNFQQFQQQHRPQQPQQPARKPPLSVQRRLITIDAGRIETWFGRVVASGFWSTAAGLVAVVTLGLPLAAVPAAASIGVGACLATCLANRW